MSHKVLFPSLRQKDRRTYWCLQKREEREAKKRKVQAMNEDNFYLTAFQCNPPSSSSLPPLRKEEEKFTILPPFSVSIPEPFKNYYLSSSVLSSSSRSSLLNPLNKPGKEHKILPFFSLHEYHIFTNTNLPQPLLTFPPVLSQYLSIFFFFLKNSCHFSQKQTSKNFDLKGTIMIGYTVNAIGATGFFFNFFFFNFLSLFSLFFSFIFFL